MSFESVKKTFDFGLKNPPIFVFGMFSGMVNLLFGVLFGVGVGAAVLASAFKPSVLSNHAVLLGGAAALIASVVFMVLLQLLASTYFTAATYRFIKTKNLQTSFKEAVIVFPSLLAAQLIKYGIYIVVSLIVVVVLVVIYGFYSLFSSGGWVLALIFFIFMLVAALVLLYGVAWVYTRLTFIDFFICVGKLAPIEAVKKSFSHSKARFTLIFGTTALYGLILMVFLFPINFVLAFIPLGNYLSSLLSSTINSLFNVLVVHLYFEIEQKNKEVKASPKTRIFGDTQEYVPPNARE
ncbi:MAG: hypothetical protein KKD39_06940 [Candidatus Altiarchaeota archaeon]|nr:hypothetical protein [Candidatus Altiarchaeota archaeon]